MNEYEKIKDNQSKQLGSIDSVHPMKFVYIVTVVQVLLLASVGLAMLLIGKGV